MLACLDLEGVLLPEIWIAFAEKTGIEQLRLTTRDIPDYDELMQGRLKILKDNNLKLIDIQNVIKTLSALKGLNFKIIAAGDSYNDTGMLQEADAGILFCPPENVIKEFPQFHVSRDYEEFKNILLEIRTTLSK